MVDFYTPAQRRLQDEFETRRLADLLIQAIITPELFVRDHWVQSPHHLVEVSLAHGFREVPAGASELLLISCDTRRRTPR